MFSFGLVTFYFIEGYFQFKYAMGFSVCNFGVEVAWGERDYGKTGEARKLAD